MDFVCGAFVCAVVCASPAPRRRATRTSPLQGTCHHPTTTSAAGEPARRRRRAPQEPPLLRAPKSLRAPPSWAHFSVAFSQAGDLGFPIFTKPTTMDKKWQNLACQVLIRSASCWAAGRAVCCRLCFARAAPSRHAHLATSRHLPPPNYYQRRRRARTAPQASPARTPAIARAKILKSSPLLGSFLGRIFTSWRPGFSHFHKARLLIRLADWPMAYIGDMVPLAL